MRDAVLLFLPERVGVLTGQDEEVVALCDGTRSVPRIVGELAARFPGSRRPQDLTCVQSSE
ncbi:hypothetical protein ACIF8T_18645 [Streptomyces sp. NPDC085946]|uniref:hypothetical protein n=1 Tax=Streptomyces sp. NPDC085946 TaxID=3365744 RepID=UPI0037CD89BF